MFRVDPALLGGVILRAGDTVIDLKDRWVLPGPDFGVRTFLDRAAAAPAWPGAVAC